MKRLGSLSLAGLLLAFAPLEGAAQTNGFVLQCMSARAAGQGCVTRARPDLPSSLFRDPAGVGFFDRPQLEINAAPFMPSLTFENGLNEETRGARHGYPLVSAAYVGSALAPGLHWAVGLEPIGGFGSDFKLRHALLSGTDGPAVDYESFFAAVKFGPTLAWRPTPELSVGASVSGVYAQIRDFRMPFTMDPSFAKGMGAIPQLDPTVYGPLFQQFTEMTAYGDSESYAGLTWAADFGIAWRSASGFGASASWSPRRKIALDGAMAVIDMTAQFQQMMGAMVQARVQAYGESAAVAQAAVMGQLSAAGLDLGAGMAAEYEAGTELQIPMTVGAGASIPVRPWWTLSTEVEWRQWSKAEETMPFRLSGGTNRNLNIMVNGDPSAGGFVYPFPLDWQDAWSWKVGSEIQLPGLPMLRAGYLYGENPVPVNTVFIAFPAIATRVLTLGAAARVAGIPLEVSYVRALQKEIVGCADLHLMGSEYLRSRTTMSQNVLTLGTVLTF